MLGWILLGLAATVTIAALLTRQTLRETQLKKNMQNAVVSAIDKTHNRVTLRDLESRQEIMVEGEAIADDIYEGLIIIGDESDEAEFEHLKETGSTDQEAFKTLQAKRSRQNTSGRTENEVEFILKEKPSAQNWTEKIVDGIDTAQAFGEVVGERVIKRVDDTAQVWKRKVTSGIQDMQKAVDKRKTVHKKAADSVLQYIHQVEKRRESKVEISDIEIFKADNPENDIY